MTATLAKLSEGNEASGKKVIYGVTFTSTYPVAGEPIDISADFSKILTARAEYADAIADHGIKFDIAGPNKTTAVTAANVLLVGHWSGTSGAVLAAMDDGEDLTGITSLRVIVIGKPLNPSNYKG